MWVWAVFPQLKNCEKEEIFKCVLLEKWLKGNVDGRVGRPGFTSFVGTAIVITLQNGYQ